MKGRSSKTNIDLAEPPGAFVGAESVQELPGTPPTKTRGRKRVSGDNFHAGGESTATSISAARKPTYWRRGGFVSGYAKGGSIKRQDGGKVESLSEPSEDIVRRRGIDKLKSRFNHPRYPEFMSKLQGENAQSIADSVRKEPDGYKRGGKLTMAQRKSLPSTSFALPGKGKGPSGKGAGSYPIPDASHARNALARVSQHGSSAEKATVRAKVHRKFPGIGQK